jgi:adenine-specific DNA methylase
MLISLADYGNIHKKSPDTVRRMAENGLLTTAYKIGRNWVVDSEELYPINRRQSKCQAKDKKIKKQVYMRYSNETVEKTNGIVYTPSELAEYVASNMVSNSTIDKNEVSILDPAIGEGELVIALIRELNRQHEKIKINVYGFETNYLIIDKTIQRIESEFCNSRVTILHKNFLIAYSENQISYDFIIANPPYIRTQILGSEKAQEIAYCAGLDGRIDIYYAFLIYCSKLLNANGIAGFITSNKFMSIKSGRAVREFLLRSTNIFSVTDFGDTKLFKSAVLPCVLIFGSVEKDSIASYTSVYSSKNEDSKHLVKNVFDGLNCTQTILTEDGQCYDVVKGELEANPDGTPWRIKTNIRDNWLSLVDKKTAKRFSDIGKIRVGIKTTADNVFIMKSWRDENNRPELLRPLITHRNAGQIISGNTEYWSVLYTHTNINGKKVAYDINEYPNSKKYLEKHRGQLESRTYIQKAKRNWYEIWVPQNPNSWKNRKIVFRDIAETPQFWIDYSGAIVNGDCYWIDIFDGIPEDEVYLALAIANSDFIQKYYDTRFNNKLYSGKRRFMAQYVEEFPLPDSSSIIAKTIIGLVENLISSNSPQILKPHIMDEINILVNQIFIT